jgi:hypothetical protein
MMVALPDGRVVYTEWFDPTSARDAGQIRTGLLYLEDKPFWLQSDKLRITHPGGVWDIDAWTADGDKTPWLNVANRLGIVLRGAKHISYSARQLVLNDIPNGDQPPACMTAVFYPKADRTATARANAQVSVTSQGGALLVELGDKHVILNPTDKAVEVTRDDKSTKVESLHGIVVQDSRTESHGN